MPHEGWPLDQLNQYARAESSAITQSEQSVTAHYWQLGLALSLARRHFSHGQWGKFLEELGVDKTRASKACAIHRTFKQQELVEGLSVQEAYQRRERKPSTKTRRKMSTGGGFFQWLRDVCKHADFFLDEAACTEPNDAASGFSQVVAHTPSRPPLRRSD